MNEEKKIDKAEALTQFIGKLWPWKREDIEQNSETWVNRQTRLGVEISKYDYGRNFVKYKITNRYTGSVTIKKVYIDNEVFHSFSRYL